MIPMFSADSIHSATTYPGHLNLKCIIFDTCIDLSTHRFLILCKRVFMLLPNYYSKACSLTLKKQADFTQLLLLHHYRKI